MLRSRTTRASAGIATAALLLGGLVAAGPPSADAVPGVPVDRFDLTSVGWSSHRDQSSAAFASTFQSRADDGDILLDLDIDTADDYRVGSVWQDNTDGRDWREKRNLTGAQYATEWADARDDGLRPVEQETYVLNGSRRWAGVWIDNVEGYEWASHRGQTATQFSASFEQHHGDGLMPVDFDTYQTGNGRRYDSVWVQKPPRTGWYLYHGLTSAGFGAKFDELDDDGYRLLAHESLETAAGQRYAGIWVTNDGNRGWSARRDLTARSYQNWWGRYRDLGYRLVGFNRYDAAAGIRYSGIWRQNSTRPGWALRPEVDAAVQGSIAGSATPGVSVAVYQNGSARYLRGFGYADLDRSEWMDSTHVGTLASVSKAVGGTLTMRMVEQDDLELADRTRTWVPAMPVKHRHTIGQLASNRGCVRHYASGQDGFADESYATARAAADEFWDDAMLCNPSTTTAYNYSTHGYTLLGAALESAGGTNVKALVRGRLTNPENLGTLGPQNLAAAHRMTAYEGSDPDEYDTPNNDWKVLGGGLDSNATDLARFGAKLMNGSILTQDSLDTMWTAPDSTQNYGMGWDLGTATDADGKKTLVAAKGGSWEGTLAYLRLYPEHDIAVAVIMNSRDGASANTLGKSIGALVLAAD